MERPSRERSFYDAPVKDGEMLTILRESAEDRRLSRSEKKALRAVVEDAGLDRAALSRFRRHAFVLARELASSGRESAQILDWLEDTVKALTPREEARRAEVHFSPGEDCLRAIVANMNAAREQIDICVFTITDDRISAAIVEAAARGVALRVVTDDDKAFDRGSDIARLDARGIEVRVDGEPSHMHHKFAIFDRRILLTGSYNWTRSAASVNDENLMLVDEPRLVGRFAEHFERLWSRYR